MLSVLLTRLINTDFPARNSASFAPLFYVKFRPTFVGILQIRPDTLGTRETRGISPSPPKMIVFDTQKYGIFDAFLSFISVLLLSVGVVCIPIKQQIFWSNSTSLDCRSSLSLRALVFLVIHTTCSCLIILFFCCF